MATKWYLQIWIGSENFGKFSAYYEYSGIPLSEAIDRAKRSYRRINSTRNKFFCYFKFFFRFFHSSLFYQ